MKRGSISLATRLLQAAAALVCLALAAIPGTAQDDPPSQAGRLSIVNGTVSIQPGGTQDWGQAYLNYPLGPGDRIFTDSDGRAEIQVGRTYVRLGPNTDVTFVNFTDDAITFATGQGAVRIRSFGMWDNQSLYVQTPSGTATSHGLASFRVDVYRDEQTAIFSNNGGDLYISGANDFGMDAVQNQALELVGTNPVYPQWLQPNPPDALDDWSESRSQQIARATWRYVSPEAPGADELDAYGQWTPGTEYGDMWFPAVQAGWAPYHNGRWVNHAPWGWVWVEEEPWGYAPFHYGRWINYHGRWGWIPGAREQHPVWSPALVAFAGGVSFGGGGGVGVSVWFPLGPGEPYRPWYPCSPRYVDRVNITNIRETNVVHVQKTYVNIVNVTNVTNITYVNRTVGVTAMRQQDFASGRSVSQAEVHVDAQQMQHAQMIAKPQVAPTRAAVISAPPARPVPVAATRPVMINAKGMSVSAQPKARPIPPPVKTAPTPPSLPNRAVVAPPPNVKMTPAAQKAMQAAPRTAQQPAANRPGQPQVQPPVPAKPATSASPAAHQPTPVSPNQQRPAPVQTPAARPAAQPPAQPTARPEEKPAPKQQPVVPPAPAERPAPHTAPPPPPARQNAEPPQKPAPHQQQPPPDKNKKPEEKDKNKEKDKQPQK
jgi:hypothetical protein